MMRPRSGLPTIPQVRDGEVVRDFCEFSGRSISDIVDGIRNARSLNRADFEVHGDARAFYAASETYIYDLLCRNWSPAVTMHVLETFLPGVLELIRRHPGDRLLDFGGGTGTFSAIAGERLGKRVTYVDIDGLISRFARWRFAKHHLEVDVRIVPQDDFEIEGSFDVVYTDAVLEHLPPEQQLRYARKLARLVDRGGLLILLVDVTGHQADIPMHHDVDLRALHEAVSSCGLGCHLGRHDFASIWGRDLSRTARSAIRWLRWRRTLARWSGRGRLDDPSQYFGDPDDPSA
jgi:SAM-dependent methyltransferase